MSRKFIPKPVTELVAHMETVATFCDERADHIRRKNGHRGLGVVGDLGARLRTEAGKLPRHLSEGAWGSAGHAVLQWRVERLLRGVQRMDNPVAYPHLVPYAHGLLDLCEVVRFEAEVAAAEGEVLT